MKLAPRFYLSALLIAIVSAGGLLIAPASAHAQQQPMMMMPPGMMMQRTLLVSGDGQASARPDRAIVRVGAVAQAATAGEAQQQVNKIMQDAIAATHNLGVLPENMTTVQMNLYPVYSQIEPPRRAGDQPSEPRIVGYRATQSLRVQLDELALAGKVIDASVNAGANQIEELTFTLRDDTAQRQQALEQAARQAQSKAQALARSLSVELGPVHMVEEVVFDVFPQPAMMRTMQMEMAQSAPVEPGEVNVRASVRVRYQLK